MSTVVDGWFCLYGHQKSGPRVKCPEASCPSHELEARLAGLFEQNREAIEAHEAKLPEWLRCRHCGQRFDDREAYRDHGAWAGGCESTDADEMAAEERRWHGQTGAPNTERPLEGRDQP